jgi:hypothetical protein
MPVTPRLPAGRSTAGQASVELVALLPLVALLAVAAWQLAVAGHAVWAAEAAARAAARADAVGGDAEAAARARLTPALDATLRVRREDGWVHVSVRVPEVLPIHLGRTTAVARFGAEGA